MFKRTYEHIGRHIENDYVIACSYASHMFLRVPTCHVVVFLIVALHSFIEPRSTRLVKHYGGSQLVTMQKLCRDIAGG